MNYLQLIDLVTVLEAILMSRQLCENLQCLTMYKMAFLEKNNAYCKLKLHS